MISRTNIAAIVSYHLRFRGTAMIVRTLDKAVGLADLGVQRFAAKRTKSESDGKFAAPDRPRGVPGQASPGLTGVSRRGFRNFMYLMSVFSIRAKVKF